MGKELLERFSIEFSSLDLRHRQVSIQDGQIHAFFLTIENEEVLKSCWEEVTSWIAGRFQAKVESEFEQWNIYLFFMVPFKIDISLKYSIENDTFSSRKIVIEGGQAYDKILAEHIINSDLRNYLSPTIYESNSIDKDPDLAELLSNISIRNRKNKNEAKSVFESLCERLRKKYNED
ncbi:MAG: hypothetical protein RIC35_25030 [Marinoscillum sp.]